MLVCPVFERVLSSSISSRGLPAKVPAMQHRKAPLLVRLLQNFTPKRPSEGACLRLPEKLDLHHNVGFIERTTLGREVIISRTFRVGCSNVRLSDEQRWMRKAAMPGSRGARRKTGKRRSLRAISAELAALGRSARQGSRTCPDRFHGC
jgi:hypothetical protein